MALKIIPITNGKAFFEAWPVVSQGVERVLQFAVDSHDMSGVMNEILSGNLQLWLVFDGGKYIGFFTTALRTSVSTPPIKHLLIAHLFRKKGGPSNFIEEIDEQLSKYAKDMGCTEMRFLSSRAFDKLIKPLGFTPAYTEYRKELT